MRRYFYAALMFLAFAILALVLELRAEAFSPKAIYYQTAFFGWMALYLLELLHYRITK